MPIQPVSVRGACLGAAALLSGCIGSAPLTPVRNEIQAIAMAKERCSTTRPFDPGEKWHAKMRDGQWHVWLSRDLDPREPVVGNLDIWIRAGDGAAGACDHAN